MTLNEFFNVIDEKSKPELYIVRLEYKYCYEDKPTRSNEILQFDPGYRAAPNVKYPWYHDCWLWYVDWYMCVEPESVRVLNWKTLDNAITDYNCYTCKFASIYCTRYEGDVAATDYCGNWHGDD